MYLTPRPRSAAVKSMFSFPFFDTHSLSTINRESMSLGLELVAVQVWQINWLIGSFPGQFLGEGVWEAENSGSRVEEFGTRIGYFYKDAIEFWWKNQELIPESRLMDPFER